MSATTEENTGKSWVDVDAVDAPGFGLADDLPPFSTDWHQHAPHQLLYADRGLLRLRTREAQWWLPPRKAAWIRSGVEHQVRADGPVALRTVYFRDAPTADEADDCVVFPVVPLAREMILFAMDWGPTDAPDSALARDYFDLLGRLALEWRRMPHPFRLPVARDPDLLRACEWAVDRLSEPLTLERVAAQVGMAPRTLHRRFVVDLDMTWGDYLTTARMVAAMEQLAAAGTRVTDVALDVGYESLSAFGRAFRRFVGVTPKDYQRSSGAGGDKDDR